MCVSVLVCQYARHGGVFVCVSVLVCVCVCVCSFYVAQYDMLINHSNQRHQPCNQSQFCCNRVGGWLLVSQCDIEVWPCLCLSRLVYMLVKFFQGMVFRM